MNKAIMITTSILRLTGVVTCASLGALFPPLCYMEAIPLLPRDRNPKDGTQHQMTLTVSNESEILSAIKSLEAASRMGDYPSWYHLHQLCRAHIETANRFAKANPLSHTAALVEVPTWQKQMALLNDARRLRLVDPERSQQLLAESLLDLPREPQFHAVNSLLRLGYHYRWHIALKQ